MTTALAGQPSPLRSARNVNLCLAAGEYVANLALGTGHAGRSRPFNNNLICVRNSTSGNRDRGHVVQLGELLLEDLDNRLLWFDAGLPDTRPLSRFAILHEPVQGDEIGPAVVAGCCLAWVDVLDINHRSAVPVEGEYILDSALTGPLEILSPISETGEQEVAVRFREGFEIVLGQTDASHAKGADGTVNIYYDPSTDTGQNITATNLFAGLASGKWTVAAKINDKWYLIAGEC